jgi:hypothetical protein
MKMDYGNSARGLKDLSAEQQALLVGWIRDVLSERSRCSRATATV